MKYATLIDSSLVVSVTWACSAVVNALYAVITLESSEAFALATSTSAIDVLTLLTLLRDARVVSAAWRVE